ncbi:MAG TPA: alpha/beta hydrolase [Bryobacteraceae bacterium]|jgi:pimeloyl-ACP methyl ester carboxylesterase|nr:alpha/beta hydrolase [Bryobacteraceae bacterium]
MSEFAVVAGHRIEFQRIEVSRDAPVIVFLHEGLGSIALWRDFPERLARAAGYNALLYSRYGYGKSDPLAEARRPSYLHEEALAALPELLEKTGIERPVLFGHSDGASIALIFASAHRARAVIALAPHVFVEQMAVDGVAEIRRDYEQGSLREKLARYHDHPDSAFYGWNDIWLAPEFRLWCIEEELSRITIPVLAVQGYEDEYATMEQLDRMEQRIRRFQALKLDDCRHSPHRDQPEAVIGATRLFLQENDTPNGTETAPRWGH